MRRTGPPSLQGRLAVKHSVWASKNGMGEVQQRQAFGQNQFGAALTGGG